MTRVFIASTARVTRWAPYARANFHRVLRAASESRDRRIRVVDSPQSAELVLFVESGDDYQFDVAASAIYRKYRRTSVVMDTRDDPMPRIPGLYASVPPYLHRTGIYRTGFYLRVADNRFLDEPVSVSSCRYLFSFVGRVDNCSRVRAPLLHLKHARGLVLDRHSGQADADAEYFDILKRSKFVLCPRGRSLSTWRCYEAMRAGRVPVILSDGWLPPDAIPWSSFSVRVPEAHVKNLVAVLEEQEANAAAMGALAHDVWQQHFSYTEAFGWIVRQGVAILRRLAQGPGVIPPMRGLGLREAMMRRRVVPFGRAAMRRVLVTMCDAVATPRGAK